MNERKEKKPHPKSFSIHGEGLQNPLSTSGERGGSEVLQTHNLATGYPGKIISSALNVEIRPGELVCLIGPNGAGKSTLLRTLAGMQKPLHGSITLLGDALARLKPVERARRISVVLTHRLDAGLLSGYELVALGRHPYTNWMGRLSHYDEAVIRWAVEVVGAENLASRQVAELSDGERQKILIARALAQEPALMILDEPTAFLDLPRRAEIMHLLRTLAHETGRAILLSTHDLDLALRTADRVWLMSQDGVLHVGAPEDLILSGAFESAFAGSGVIFDRETGTFQVETERLATIKLIGEGVEAFWTRRALEREGFAVTLNGAPSLAQVEVEVGDGVCWRLAQNGQQEIYHSVADLMAALGKVQLKE